MGVPWCQRNQNEARTCALLLACQFSLSSIIRLSQKEQGTIHQLNLEMNVSPDLTRKRWEKSDSRKDVPLVMERTNIGDKHGRTC